MDSARWIKIKELFVAAFDLAGDERSAFLATCDQDLRLEVEQLLNADAAAGDFIDEPAMVEIGLASDDEPIDAYLGKQIDSYKIVREIGHGGMGTVYLANRADESFDRSVAVKLIKRGMDTSAVLKRFVMERQILAQLQHPNIANLLDGGTTADGLPYFVMEYVEGEPITRFCDSQAFTTDERLDLFRKVCSAMSYAHQNLIVHRDIKPSNILVTENGTPKLLDFGIAKMLHPDWSLDTHEATATMFRVMTPEYASPEQMRGLAITTASDVYSLGVVLYELLCGQRPYKVDGRMPEEAAKIVLTEEPPKPSSVVSRRRWGKGETIGTNGNLTGKEKDTGEARSIRNPESAVRNLKGDIDNIILKALAKEPERRYQSVQELSEDIRRHLEGLPVTASADSVSYRVAKFAKRHRTGVIAGGMVILTLFAATAITSWQAIVARRERDKAEQRFNQVRKLAKAVLFDYQDGIAKLAGSTPLRAKMVTDALEYLDNLSSESSGDADLQRELAAAYQKVGDVQGAANEGNLGNRENAIESYRKSLAILESITPAEPDNLRLVEIAAVHGKLYTVLWSVGRQEEAEADLNLALTVRQQLVASEPDNLVYRLALARGYRDFGGMLVSKTKKDGEGGIAYYEKSNELCDSIVKTDPSNLEARAIAGLGYRMLGAEFELANKLEQAMECYQKALALTREREKLDPQNAQIQLVLSNCYGNIGRAFMLKDDVPNALLNFNLELSIVKSRLAEDPDNALLKQELSQTYNNTGNALAQSGSFPQALENYKQALNIRETYLKDHPTESSYQTRLGETTFDLGDLYAKMAGRTGTSVKDQIMFWSQARFWYQRSLEVWQTLSKNGTLPGYQAAKPDETSKAIDNCAAALLNLSSKKPGH